MPDPEQNFLNRLFRFLFGSFAPLAREIYHHAMTFVFIAFSLFCVRYVVEHLFEPTDALLKLLHFIDLYGTLLGLIGFAVWMTICIANAILRLIRGGGEGEGEDDTE